MKYTPLMDDPDAFALIDAIRRGDEPSLEWVRRLAVWADHKAERACWYERQIEDLLEIRRVLEASANHAIHNPTHGGV